LYKTSSLPVSLRQRPDSHSAVDAGPNMCYVSWVFFIANFGKQSKCRTLVLQNLCLNWKKSILALLLNVLTVELCNLIMFYDCELRMLKSLCVQNYKCIIFKGTSLWPLQWVKTHLPTFNSFKARNVNMLDVRVQCNITAMVFFKK
jgi:hypothetical protein